MNWRLVGNILEGNYVLLSRVHPPLKDNPRLNIRRGLFLFYINKFGTIPPNQKTSNLHFKAALC